LRALVRPCARSSANVASVGLFFMVTSPRGGLVGYS
jgi:hypothetical protein